MRERVLGAARTAVERLGGAANAAFDMLVKDDVDKLVGRDSTPLQRLEGGVGLASWAIPEGKVAEIAAHAVAKAVETSAAHAAEAAAETAVAHLAAGAAEHAATPGAEHLGEGLAASAAREPERALSATERAEGFRSEKDFKRFMGPAGEGRDWHHIVEKNHAKSGLFPPELIHNVDNVVAVPREIHRRVGGLSSAFGKRDPDLGTSLREYLHDKPWSEHVQLGDDALRARGLDPHLLRAETRERFEQRLAEREPRIAAREQHPEGGLRVLRGDQERNVGRGYQQPGTIVEADGDRIVQNVGRGQTATYSRSELLSQANPADRPFFDAALRPGNNVEVRLGRNGLSMQQNVPGHGWEPIGANALAPAQSLGLGAGGR